MIDIDAFGMTCPKPVILAMQALQRPEAAGAVRVLVDNAVAVENLKRLAASKAGSVSVDAVDGGWAVEISGVAAEAAQNPAGDEAALAEAGIACPVPEPAPAATTVLVGSASFGQGSEELGGILIKGLVYAMSQAENPPSRMVFYNGGAPLTCEGSPMLDDIRELERRGCEILTCGTCLDFHGLRDELAVGGVTNLYAISEILLGSDRKVTL
ncbi:sulfurtransferase-like selenium metabolism protein YedF [Enorma phocaeensis]|uniref:sulfurtransferase-like selenium metabolism protein YedF n=1 Tax=Enorma phocaeensis TaxID=1871019 RepID=UPI001EF6116A|nr:sulfurtransferase-like selenium metabolism protein YedF [Enorma phocaeensis]